MLNQNESKANLKEKIEGYEARKEKARLAFEAELERLGNEQDGYIKRFIELSQASK